MRQLARTIPFTFALALTIGCGGGGGGAALPSTSVSGTLRLPQAVPQVLAQRMLRVEDPFAGSSLARARPLRRDATGALDRYGRRLAVHRWVSDRRGRVRVRLESDRADGLRYALHHLDRGDVGTVLAVEAGDVVDLLVWSDSRNVAYRIEIEEAGTDPGRTVELPQEYLDGARLCRPGEVVVGPGDGEDAFSIAAACGLRCTRRSAAAFLLRDRDAATSGDSEWRALCRVLAHCARLEASGRVRYAEPNYLRRLTVSPDDPEFAGQWALEQIRVPAAWELDRGEQGLVVAIVDSGVMQAHPELAGRLVPGYDFQDNDDDPEDPKRTGSHGTQVAGIIAAATNNGQGVAGVLWDGRILPVRAFDESGFGDSFSVSNAIRFAAGLENSSGRLPPEPAQVINLSFASRSSSAAEQSACDAAYAAGVFLVAASGNDGQTQPNYPAAYDSVVAVGATDRSARRASYSNYGNWLELVAPGGTAFDGIRVATTFGGQPSEGFANGTSFSSPHVAGVAALCLGVRSFSPAELRLLLLTTAQDVGVVGPDLFTGHGIVHAFAALAAAREQPQGILIPGEKLEIRLVQESTGRLLYTGTTSESASLRWSLAGVVAGSYILEAGTDRDFDGSIDDAGEVYGRWSDGQGNELIEIDPEVGRTDLDIQLAQR